MSARAVVSAGTGLAHEQSGGWDHVRQRQSIGADTISASTDVGSHHVQYPRDRRPWPGSGDHRHAFIIAMATTCPGHARSPIHPVPVRIWDRMRRTRRVRPVLKHLTGSALRFPDARHYRGTARRLQRQRAELPKLAGSVSPAAPTVSVVVIVMVTSGRPADLAVMVVVPA
jgi:hypothetical protein